MPLLSHGMLWFLSPICVALLFKNAYNFLSTGSEVPEIEVGYWGPGEPRPDDKTIRPFRIRFPERDVNYLKKKLELSRELTPPLDGIGFEYGMNTKYLGEFLEYWRTKYNWTEREEFLNKYPSYKTTIGGLDIHFLHVKPDPALVKGKEVVPLLVVHGWPGSVREFYDLLPLLSTPRPDADYVFEVVVPSLPGYGFSQASTKAGFEPPHAAAIFGELMTRLGFKRFFYQGGDWGSVIGHCLSMMHPERLLGFHSNFCLPTTPAARALTVLAFLFPKWIVEEDKLQHYTGSHLKDIISEAGYFTIQATKPDAMGVGLSDSPAGLAAWILDKFAAWTKLSNRLLENGGLDSFEKDALLDHIMIYWLTNSVTPSMRYYKLQWFHKKNQWWFWGRKILVPTHCARFGEDPLFIPKMILELQYNLISVADFDRGGHFAAFEEPKLFGDDVWDFVGRIRRSNITLDHNHSDVHWFYGLTEMLTPIWPPKILFSDSE